MTASALVYEEFGIQKVGRSPHDLSERRRRQLKVMRRNRGIKYKRGHRHTRVQLASHRVVSGFQRRLRRAIVSDGDILSLRLS